MKRLGLLVAVCLTAFLGLPANAQTSSSPTRADLDAAIGNEHQNLRRQIAEQYALLEQHTALVKKVVQFVMPSVVHLESTKSESPSSTGMTIEEAGSGVIVQFDADHYVLTNRHVVADARLQNIVLRLNDGRVLRASKKWTDPDTDVAVLKISASGLVPAITQQSSEVGIGDFVLAVGSPFGLSHSVSYGIISAKGRRDLELGDDNVRLQDFLQTDAAVNPGNSGGPLCNLRGEVIGINTAIASSSGGNEGVSFAIPIELVLHVAKQLVSRGQVSHAYLGVQLDGDFDYPTAMRLGLGDARGALVKGVTPRSPAFFANLQVNDLITAYDETKVEDDDHLVNLVSLTPINQTVTLKIIRKQKPMTIRVTVGNRRHFEPVR